MGSPTPWAYSTLRKKRDRAGPTLSGRVEGVLFEVGFVIAILSVTALARHFLASVFSDTGSAQQCCHLVLEKSQGAAGLDDSHEEQGEAM